MLWTKGVELITVLPVSTSFNISRVNSYSTDSAIHCNLLSVLEESADLEFGGLLPPPSTLAYWHKNNSNSRRGLGKVRFGVFIKKHICKKKETYMHLEKSHRDFVLLCVAFSVRYPKHTLHHSNVTKCFGEVRVAEGSRWEGTSRGGGRSKGWKEEVQRDFPYCTETCQWFPYMSTGPWRPC